VTLYLGQPVELSGIVASNHSRQLQRAVARRIEVEIPVNAPPNRPCRIWVDNGADLFGSGVRTEEFEVCDQYTIQGDLFSKAVRDGGEPPTPLEDSIRNMAVIEAAFRSAREGAWMPV
jgi:hypothetical protein